MRGLQKTAVVLLGCLFGAVLSPGAFAADIRMDCERLALRVEGPIERGDAGKFLKVFQEARNSCGVEEGQFLDYVDFNSGGGDYWDALGMALIIDRSGLQTRVRYPGRCVGPCALAFLAGKYWGTSIGFGPDKNIDFGAELALTRIDLDRELREGESFMEWSDDRVTLVQQVYELFLRQDISPVFLNDIWALKEGEKYEINTPGRLRALRIKVQNRGNDFDDGKISPRSALEAAHNAVTDPGRGGWSTWDWDYSKADLKVQKITGWEFMADLLLKYEDESRRPFIARQISRAKQKNRFSEIAELYKTESKKLDLPGLAPEGAYYKVSGFTNAHAYMNLTAYVAAGGSDEPKAVYLVRDYDGFELEARPIRDYWLSGGDLIYTLHPMDKPLW